MQHRSICNRLPSECLYLGNFMYLMVPYILFGLTFLLDTDKRKWIFKFLCVGEQTLDSVLQVTNLSSDKRFSTTFFVFFRIMLFIFIIPPFRFSFYASLLLTPHFLWRCDIRYVIYRLLVIPKILFLKNYEPLNVY